MIMAKTSCVVYSLQGSLFRRPSLEKSLSISRLFWKVDRALRWMRHGERRHAARTLTSPIVTFDTFNAVYRVDHFPRGVHTILMVFNARLSQASTSFSDMIVMIAASRLSALA